MNLKQRLDNAGYPCWPSDLDVLSDRYAARPCLAGRNELFRQLARTVLNLKGVPPDDDSQSEAMLALWECLERWPEKQREQNNILKYVVVSVKWRVHDLQDERIFGPPGRQAREMREKGDHVPNPVSMYDKDGNPKVWPKLATELDTTLEDGEEERKRCEHNRKLFTEEEWAILEARDSGLNYRELSRVFERSLGWLSNFFKKLGQRLNTETKKAA